MTTVSLVKRTIARWIGDRGPSLAAALAFYATLSLAPLLVIAVSVAGLVFGDAAARGELTHQFSDLMGPDGAATAQAILAHAGSAHAGLIGATVSVVVLLLGASGVFIELQDDLNLVWGVKSEGRSEVVSFLRQRVISFAMVLSIGILLLASLVVSAALAAVGSAFAAYLPGGKALWSILDVVVSLGVITLLFAAIFKWVPDAKIAWHDVWIGAAVTALLFTVGKALLGFYLGRANVGSPYGAASSLVVLIVWVYYSSQIFLLGAELTRACAERDSPSRGSRRTAPRRFTS